MIVVVCYDVCVDDNPGRRRLRHVAEACKDHGVRVQYSVFECQVDDAQWVAFRHRLLEIIKPDEDSLRFYFIDEKALKKTEHHGVRKPLDLREALVF